MLRVKKILKYLALAFLLLIVLIAGTVTYLYKSADMRQPSDVPNDLSGFAVTEHEGYTECKGNMLRLNGNGLWEAYLHGESFERGAAFGRLSEKLLYYQEKVFVDQIKAMIPSERYLKFLRFFLVLFNRNLGDAVPEEYRREIYGISLSCSDEFNWIGRPYERQLNYHAAHDIGHTMQDYMLVGCSAFAAWGGASADSSLIIGRNFDFWVGEDFAENKLVSFYKPEHGYGFVSVGWPGMTGLLSGMNEAGLTVTINAAKGDLPLSAATPISVLAREILQYASDIAEAREIASSRRTFVSESLLIGSAKDGKAAVIEKTPEVTALFHAPSDRLVVTNHYQSRELENDTHNTANILGSDSKYRFDRINELLDGMPPVDVTAAAAILRDRLGPGGTDIGLTNEKSINQSIAHHSVIFKPEQGLIWVSTFPWQSGEYICYNLGEILARPDFSGPIDLPGLTIPADSTFLGEDYERVLRHRQLTTRIRTATATREEIPAGTIEEYIANNPLFFETHSNAGDYYKSIGQPDAARGAYRRALELEIPTAARRASIGKELKKLK